MSAAAYCVLDATPPPAPGARASEPGERRAYSYTAAQRSVAAWGMTGRAALLLAAILTCSSICSDCAGSCLRGGVKSDDDNLELGLGASAAENIFETTVTS